MIQAGVLLAGGSGNRFGSDLPKQFLPLKGRPLIDYSIEKFLQKTDLVVVVCHPSYFDRIKPMERVLLAPGGKTRQLSVRSGLEALQKVSPHIVSVHDGARPLFSTSLLSATLKSAQNQGSGIAAIEVSQTLCQATQNRVTGYVSREDFKIIQTPQSFRYSTLLSIHQNTTVNDASDDSQLWHQSGNPVFLVEGETSNIKITYPSDIALAEKIMEKLRFQ